MNFHILGRAIARLFADHSGLGAVQIHESIDPSGDFAGVIVDELNRLSKSRRPLPTRSRDNSPFSLVVGDVIPRRMAALRANERVICTKAEALGYRYGDRVVVCLESADLTSFSKSFPILFEVNFPLVADQTRLRDLADKALEVVLQEAMSSTTRPPTSAIDTLVEIFELLKDAYVALGRSSDHGSDIQDHVLWFRHVALGLERLTYQVQTLDADLEVGEAIGVHLWAAFSLPTPDNGSTYSKGRNGSILAKRCLAVWSDKQSIANSLGMVEESAGLVAGSHPLRQIMWSDFDRLSEVGEFFQRVGPLMAWSLVDPDNGNRVPLMGQLTEVDYFERSSRSASGLELEAKLTYSADHVSLKQGIPNGAFNLIERTRLSRTRGSALVESDTIDLSIELPSDAPKEVVSEGIRVEVAGGRSSAEITDIVYRDDHLIVSFKVFRVTPVRKNVLRFQPRPETLVLSVDADNPFAEFFPPSINFTVLMLAPKGGRLIFIPSSSAKPQDLRTVGLDDLLPEETNQPECTVSQKLDDEGSYEVLAVSRQDLRPTSSLDFPFDPVPGRAGIWIMKGYVAGDRDKFVVDETTAYVEVDHDKAVRPESPLIAAILKKRPAGGLPRTVHRESLRGRIEEYLAECLGEEETLLSHGHVCLPCDLEDELHGLRLFGSGHFSITPSSTFEAAMRDLDAIPHGLAESEAGREFREAFVGLGLHDRLHVEIADGGNFTQLISRISLRSLVQSRAVDRYLAAYMNLLQHAGSFESESGRFWATYPFSVSIWAVKNGLQCRSVLLSPFHPIRLAWLAGIESTLWTSNKSFELSGLVEGWGFPRLGPTNTRQGRMIAVPSDSGEDQLFSGWSQLVRASVDGPNPLAPPDFAAGLPLPGTSSSGLNGEAVAAALRDFRRVHTYMRTVTVDLSASVRSPKMTEIDRAVIRSLVTMSDEPKISGLRVFDSLRREGECPSLDGLIADGDMPFTWRRYDPDKNDQRPDKVNIRILQDSGVAVEIQSRRDARAGVVGPVPIRRYEISQRENHRGLGLSISQPALCEFASNTIFNSVVDLVESFGSSDQGPEVQTRIPADSPLSEAADWAISGESLLTPSALTEMLGASNASSRMLWEWNPPFLSSNRRGNIRTAIDRRSYFSIAAVPEVFMLRLKEKLGRLLERPAADADTTRLLEYLGTRGIGLSRLIAIGGSQIHGALGFYQTYRLLEAGGPSDKVRVVLPLDACQGFLEAIVSNGAADESQKRADLLVMDVGKESVTFTPIEIKFYGLENPTPALPEPRSAALQEARLQVARTHNVLKAVQQTWDESRTTKTEDLPLVGNALASLVEAAVRLTPIERQASAAVASSVAGLLDGRTRVEVGRPLVVYLSRSTSEPFVQTATGLAGSQMESQWAEFIADSAKVMMDLERNEGSVIQAWREVLNWSTTPDVVSEVVSERDFSVIDEALAPQETGTNIKWEPDAAEDLTAQISSGGASQEAASQSIAAADKTGEAPNPEGAQSESSSSSPDVNLDLDQHVIVGETTSAPQPEEILDLEVAGRSNGGTTDLVKGEGVRFPIGALQGSLRSADADFWPSNTALNQLNIGVVGDLGTGKTQLLQALVYQLRDSAKQSQDPSLSALILDYKRDYQNSNFLNQVGGVCLEPERIPLNIFGLQGERTPRAIQAKARSFVDVVSKIYGGVGPRQTSALTRCIRDLLSSSLVPPTMGDVLRAYLNEVDDNDSVVAILENFVYGEIFSDDPNELKSLGELLDDKVLVINLAKLGADQQTKNALVALFLNQYYEYMLTLTKWPYVQRGDVQLRALNSYLLVDEATNIMQYKFDVLGQILLQGREFGVGVMLSSQYLSHFDVPGVDYAEPLRSWFIHKVPNVTQRQLVKIGLAGATQSDADQISSLPIHHAYYVSHRFNGRFVRTKPFYEIVQLP